MSLEALTLLDISDREVLLVIRDVSDGEGYAYADDVATQLDLGGEHPHRAVASRLSWLVRYGALERGEMRERTLRDAENEGMVTKQRGWKLTPLGLSLAVGKLTKAQQDRLAKANLGELLMTTRALTARMESMNGTSKLLDREYRYGIKRRQHGH